MKLDDLRRGLDDAGRRPGIDLIDARAAVGAKSARRRRRSRQLLAVAATVIIAAIAIPIAVHESDPNRAVQVTTPSTAVVRRDAWAVIDKKDAGLGSLSSFSAIARTGSSLLLGGSRTLVITHPAPLPSQAAMWYSDDGLTWHDADVPASDTGAVHAVASSGGTALAIGSDDLGRSAFVWRSDDNGRTWKTVGRGEGLFGSPAPQMGRPFVDGLIHADGLWIASGGGSSGYAGVWTSKDGTQWRQVLDSKPGNPATAVGSVKVIDTGNGDLLAYAVNVVWKSRDGRTWSKPIVQTVPAPFSLGSIAPPGGIAFGLSELHGGPTPLLMREDASTQPTWFVARPFLSSFPHARVASVTCVGGIGGLWIAAGTSGSPNHPDAWVASSPAYWHSLPASLYGAPDGRPPSTVARSALSASFEAGSCSSERHRSSIASTPSTSRRSPNSSSD